MEAHGLMGASPDRRDAYTAPEAAAGPKGQSAKSWLWVGRNLPHCGSLPPNAQPERLGLIGFAKQQATPRFRGMARFPSAF
jgi:hypothetical protein